MKNTLFLIIIFLFSPAYVFAADFTFAASSASEGGVREVAVLIDSTLPLNAIEGVIDVASEADVIDITEAGSLVRMWIKKPAQSKEKDKISFMGIIPGGWSGKGVLFHLHLKGDVSKLTINKKETQTLINDGMGTVDPVHISQSVPLVPEFALSPKNTLDVTPPTSFVPQVGVIATEGGNTHAVMWNARDDQTGIATYQIAFAQAAVSEKDAILQWFTTTSPVLIADSKLGEYIYVKALDQAGNSRVAVIAPESTSVHISTAYISIIFAIIIVGVAIFFLVLHLRKKKYVHL